MPILIQHPTNPTDAYERAARRGVLPSALSSREQREQLSAALREMSVFSARTTNARYLQTIRKVVNAIAQGDMDMGEARVVLMQTLDALGYTPEGGFPGDMGKVPPAVEGSLQDLRSFRRLDLILRTQLELLRGAGQKMRGEEPAAMRAFPAWELVRVIEPAGERRKWHDRFEQSGGEVVDGRIIAMKGDPVWLELGSMFDDSLDVDHPPFAFNSGMRWRAVSRAELEELDVDAFVIDGEDYSLEEIIEAIPKPKVSTSGLDPDMVRKLQADLKAEKDAGGRLTFKQRLDAELERSGQS